MSQVAIQSRFSQPFDKPLDRALLDIENKQRANLLSWRGQFSPQFVETVLESYARPHDVVLDPFAGSGTVLVESARLGHEAHGFEVNPSAACLAKIYELTRLDLDERRDVLCSVDAFLEDRFPAGFPLFDNLKRPPINGDSELGFLVGESRPEMLWENTVILDALAVQLDIGKEAFTPRRLWTVWRALRSLIEALPRSFHRIQMNLGDARNLPLPDGSIDFVLTSPPYINVFNYHHNYRASVEALGWKPLVVARSEIGANRKYRQNRFLTVVQYCIDMSMSLAELHRVCRKTGRVVFVVGRESNVHKTPFYNGAILRRLAEEAAGFRTALSQERTFQNKFGKSIKEDILHLVLDRDIPGDLAALTRQARGIGIQVLEDASGRVPLERVKYLEDALFKASAVGPSPEFSASRARSSL